MHMAQLRHDYDKFVAQEAEILVVGPESQKAFQDYWVKNSLPFTGLPDPKHQVANLYGQQVKLLKLGRMPALMVIDKAGHIRYTHYGNSMQDIPPNKQILNLLSNLNAELA
jgi:peroxiredoxin Q/BCP